MSFRSRLFSLVVLTVAAMGFTAVAPAQQVQYFASGSAQFAANQSDFTGSGYATHLGYYSEVGNVAFAPTSTPGVFSVTGWAHYTASNGAELHALVAGVVDMQTGAILAVATYVGGTGRFAAASGSSVLTGQMLGGGALTISAVGTIDY